MPKGKLCVLLWHKGHMTKSWNENVLSAFVCTQQSITVVHEKVTKYPGLFNFCWLLHYNNFLDSILSPISQPIVRHIMASLYTVYCTGTQLNTSLLYLVHSFNVNCGDCGSASHPQPRPVRPQKHSAQKQFKSSKYCTAQETNPELPGSVSESHWDSWFWTLEPTSRDHNHRTCSPFDSTWDCEEFSVHSKS